MLPRAVLLSISSDWKLAIGTTVSLWVVYKAYKRLLHLTRLSWLPGPPTISYIWGHAIDTRKATVGTRYNVWRRQYGPTYLLREPLSEPVLVLGDAKGAAYVLNHTNKFWRPDLDTYILTLWFGKGILSSEADEHAQRRRRMNPAFSPQSVKEVSPVFFDLAHGLKADWEDKLGAEQSAEVNVYQDFHKLSLNGISMTMFAHDLSADSGPESVTSILNNIAGGPSDADTIGNRIAGLIISAFPQLLSIPNPMKKWADLLKRELGAIANDVWDVAEKNAGFGAMDAKVVEVLNQQRKAGEPVTREDAVSEIIGLLFAGSETVANVMGELLYELAHKPDIQRKLRAELCEFEVRNGSPPQYADLTATSKNGLEYFNAVIMETLRCKAVLMDIGRMAVVEDVIPLSTPISGTGQTSIHVYPGQSISVPVRDGINVDPDIWGEDAEEFKPERWLEAGAGEKGPGPGGLLTFGDGAKICLGRLFALAELKIVASVLVRNFSFHPAPYFDIDFYHASGNTVKPKIRGRESEGYQLPIIVRRV